MEYNSIEMIALYHDAVQCYQQSEPEKLEEGFGLLLEAAENGVTQACKMLGLLYMSGQYEPFPEKDEAMAVRWWRAAAENGDEEAMFWLGQCYEDGIGVEVNPAEAAIWKKFAVANGFVAEGEESEEGEVLSEELEEVIVVAEKKEKHKKRKKEKQQKQAETQPQLRKRFVRPVETVKAVIQKKQFQLKEVEKKQEEAAAEAQRFAREEEEARRISNQYRLRTGAGGALCCLLLLWILLLLVYWGVREPMQENMWIFWVLSALFSAVCVMGGYSLGVKKAQQRIDLVTEYRKTPFYHAHGCELGQMNKQQQWCYKIYRSLAKTYFPVTYRKKVDLPAYF